MGGVRAALVPAETGRRGEAMTGPCTQQKEKKLALRSHEHSVCSIQLCICGHVESGWGGVGGCMVPEECDREEVWDCACSEVSPVERGGESRGEEERGWS